MDETGQDGAAGTSGKDSVAVTRKQQEDVAMYLMSRADSYETDSPCWVALSDAAHNIVNGAVEKDLDYNGNEPRERDRVRRWRDKTAPERPVVSNAGVEE
jgi:hypothetical protein